MMRRIGVTLMGVLAVCAWTAAAAAQETVMPADALAGQDLRPYWHVFAAYAIVLVLVGGYVVSLARRLARLERTVGEGT